MPKISEDKKIERKKKILAAALNEFSEKGYSATSVDDIINRANISKGLIYTYFKSKEEIFLQLAEYWEEMTDQRKVLNFEFPEEFTLTEKLITIWDGIVDTWTLENLQFARIQFEFWFESSKIPQLKETMKKKSSNSFLIIENIIIKHCPSIDRNLLNAFVRLWWSQVDGLVIYFVSHSTLPNPKEMEKIRGIIEKMCEILE
ncbi:MULTISPECIES: TetR/AcrR family transcriptional regulator [unclassified Lysinibacillus]|uniref:TetR/AcrR family transcriptional regulator n=1 Tax=unclassified Lysinibacillus TaxID=2636778 RepID=UPI0038279C14